MCAPIEVLYISRGGVGVYGAWSGGIYLNISERKKALYKCEHLFYNHYARCVVYIMMYIFCLNDFQKTKSKNSAVIKQLLTDLKNDML